MSKIDERIAKQKERLEQLKRQKREQNAREKERQRKLEHRRKLIIGEKILEHFPNVLPLRLDQSAEEKVEQIALFEKQLDEIATLQTQTQNQPLAQRSIQQEPLRLLFDRMMKSDPLQQQNQQHRKQ